MTTQKTVQEGIKPVLIERFFQKYGNPPEISGWGHISYEDTVYYVKALDGKFLYMTEAQARDSKTGELKLE